MSAAHLRGNTALTCQSGTRLGCRSHVDICDCLPQFRNSQKEKLAPDTYWRYAATERANVQSPTGIVFMHCKEVATISELHGAHKSDHQDAVRNADLGNAM